MINFIHHFWPSLINLNNFVKEFSTPIIKAFKSSQSQTFFSVTEFRQWAEAQGNIKAWRIKYYKGLGTSTGKEAQEYFSNMDLHEKAFRRVDQQDDDSIDLAFNKKRANDRKQWIQTYNKDAVFPRQNIIRYRDFFNQEMLVFSVSDNFRSIPSICDGLKPGQRKILYSCFLKRLKSEIKVAQLSGYVSEKSAYHHGEVSLQQTIIGLAQRFVGSNNISLLDPNG